MSVNEDWKQSSVKVSTQLTQGKQDQCSFPLNLAQKEDSQAPDLELSVHITGENPAPRSTPFVRLESISGKRNAPEGTPSKVICTDFSGLADALKYPY